MVKNKTQKTWLKAKKIIPGGNMLLSKRPEMFLPNKWPAYYKKAKGCFIHDLDNKKYLDMSLMGVGTCILGYANTEIDNAVIKNIKRGNMSTLNCEEEYLLSEKILSFNKWADMVRYARTGGEANAIAVRLARASCNEKKQNIAICGYHGWHDWYLSANLKNKKNLDQHLLSGLNTAGVPKKLKGTVYPFLFNSIDELTKTVKKNDIGIIKMEVYRNKPPEKKFLEALKYLRQKHNLILIFDECTSGFRETFGGIHKKYNITPDICIYGKAMGNGYAITSVVGKKQIMNNAQKSFISSTFWTERIGSSAALATLKVMEKEKSWEKITSIGENINQEWKKFSAEYELPITINGLAALTTFTFKSENALAYKTLITQEMLKKGYLAATAVYACTAHTPAIIKEYLENLKPIFQMIKECEEGRDVMELLEGPIAHNGFKRLN